MRRRFTSPLVLLAAAGALLGAAGGGTVAAFTAVTANPASSFQAKAIFPAVRSTSAWDLRDASTGTETNQSGTVAFADDGRTRTTKAWAASFATNRYLDFDLSGPLPAGLSASTVTFDFRMLPNAPANTACFYFEVRRASTGAVLATHGNDTTPVACASGSTYSTVSTPIPSADNTDVANDLRIRVYARESLAQPIQIDLATVSGATGFAAFTLYEKVFVDAADTVAATTRWPIAVAADASSYDPQWNIAFSTTRYLKLSFPAYVPTGAAITSATLNHSYRSLDLGITTCHYFEVYSGVTLIGTHGSSAAPYSCNSAATYLTEAISLPEIDTVAEANNAVVKMFVRNSDSGKSQHDLATLAVDYYLN